MNGVFVLDLYGLQADVILNWRAGFLYDTPSFNRRILPVIAKAELVGNEGHECAQH
jgi:hypothetical protein